MSGRGACAGGEDRATPSRGAHRTLIEAGVAFLLLGLDRRPPTVGGTAQREKFPARPSVSTPGAPHAAVRRYDRPVGISPSPGEAAVAAAATQGAARRRDARRSSGRAG